MESEVMSTDPLLEDYEKNFKWTPELEISILYELMDFKPFGIKKYLNTQLIINNIRKKLGVSIPPTCIWEYCESKWDLKAAESKEISNLNISKKSFELPEEYELLCAARLFEINKNQVKIGINDEMNKCNLYSGPSGPRRSLRTYEKPEEKELQDSTKKTNKLPRMNNKTEIKKVTDSRQLNKNIQNQSKDLEKNNAVSIGKRKTRNVSESSFSSDNSKQYKSLKNNLTDLNVSDCSSRSVTPEMFRGKTSNRSVTPETNSRKTNLRSSDKDQKSKLSLNKKSTLFSNVNPHVELEHYKPEILEKPVIELKSKNLVQNKNELKQGKNKTRGRLTADLMVVQQSPVIQPLGRRSCSNNKSS